MDAIIGILALVVIIALVVWDLGGGTVALFFGRKLPWLWFALAASELIARILNVALYWEYDVVRGLASLAGAVLAAVLAILLQRRFASVVLVIGGFMAAGLSVIQVLGPLLNPAPEWLVIGLLLATGVAGAIWARKDPSTATIVFSALVGAGILADSLLKWLSLEEAYRFQLYAILALAGIGVQLWMRRREARAALPRTEGA